MSKITIVDPPSGWQYGFPKPIPADILGDDEKFADWLFMQGYPADQIEFALKYSRYWEGDDYD